MRQVILNIPENKYKFFMELMNSLGFSKAEEYYIPEEHKTIVRDRIQKYNQDPSRLLEWDDVQDNFNLD